MNLGQSTLKRLLSLYKTLYSKKMLIIACFPKSASTFLQNTIAEVGGLNTDELSDMQARNEQDLAFHRLVDGMKRDTVTHLHMQANDVNRKYLKLAGATPTVLVRNLYDCIVSFRDHLNKNSLKMIGPYVSEDFLSFDNDKQLDMVIDLFVPWYLSFFVSWIYAEKEGLSVNWLTYEELMQDKPGTIQRLCEQYGIACTFAQAEEAVSVIQGDRGRSNFNVGVSGRGVSTLNESHLARIQKLRSYYPSIDFSRIGL